MASPLARTITTMALTELVNKNSVDQALTKFFGAVVNELTDAELNRINTRLVDLVKSKETA